MKKAPTPSLRDTPPLEGNFLGSLSLFGFLFPSWEDEGVGYILHYFHSHLAPKSDMKAYYSNFLCFLFKGGI